MRKRAEGVTVTDDMWARAMPLALAPAYVRAALRPPAVCADLVQPECSRRGCRHFRMEPDHAAGHTDAFFMVCAAFPQGIPSDIVYGPNLHIAVDPRQVGAVVYEKGPPSFDLAPGQQASRKPDAKRRRRA